MDTSTLTPDKPPAHFYVKALEADFRDFKSNIPNELQNYSKSSPKHGCDNI
jgi:hypothetical protein